jgi:hypothetical protein
MADSGLVSATLSISSSKYSKDRLDGILSKRKCSSVISLVAQIPSSHLRKTVRTLSPILIEIVQDRKQRSRNAKDPSRIDVRLLLFRERITSAGDSEDEYVQEGRLRSRKNGLLGVRGGLVMGRGVVGLYRGRGGRLLRRI